MQPNNLRGGPRRLDPNTPPVNGPVRVTPDGASPLVSKPAPVAKPQVKEEVTQIDDEGKALGSEWTRIEFPSRFIFYEWSDVALRPFEPIDQAKLARGIKHKNTTTIFDVIASTSTRDPREWSVIDLRAALLWHKYNSYLTTPFKIRWPSKYGVEGTTDSGVTFTREIANKKTREEYLEWVAKGFSIPRCRDMEIFEGSVDEETEYLFERAQWIDPTPLASRIAELRAAGDRAPTVTARIEELNRRGLKRFAEYDEFAKEFVEYDALEFARVQLADKDFNPEKATAALRASGVQENMEESLRIEAALAKGEKYRPMVEEVPVTFDLWNMFPYI